MLSDLPTLLAYEQGVEGSVRLAKITRFSETSSLELRFEFETLFELPSLTSDVLTGFAWDLDLGRLEMSRTHWAVKDVDLLRVLADAGVVVPAVVSQRFEARAPGETPRRTSLLEVSPTVFSIPSGGQDSRLVSVMMPFDNAFDPVYQAIRNACMRVRLRCERADDLWSASTVIQDVFELIYHSALTIADITGLNSNVMYEVGIAHTLGRVVVPISQRIDQLPFDLAHHRVLAYQANANGLADMEVTLERRLRTITQRT